MSELTAVLLARYHGTAGYAVLAALLGGRHSSAYKLVFNELARVLHEHWFDKLMSVTRFAHKAPQWANAIFRRTHASPRVIGFLDGTFIRVCRPSGPYSHQRQLYNRYYKGHGYKFQSMMAACGLMFSLFGPVVGRMSDSAMLGRSPLLAQMETISELTNWHMALYADSAYPRSAHLLRGMKRHMIQTAMQQEYQTAMNSARTAVEWGFGCILQQFPWMYSLSLKAKLSPVAVHWQLAGVLTNVFTCLAGGNVVSDYFGCPCPSLGDYLSDP